MRTRRRSAAGLAAVLALLATAGCGYSVDALAPYDDPAAIPVPRSLGAAIDATGRIVLTWGATPADRTIVDGWIVERRPSDTTTFTQVTPALLPDTTWADDEVAEGERFVYRVRAVTGAGVIGAPAETPVLRADRTAPGPPQTVTAVSAPGGVTLTFVPGPEPDLAFFDVRIREQGAGTPPQFRTVGGSPASILGLTAGATYGFEVAAIDSAGRISAYSAPPATAVAGP